MSDESPSTNSSAAPAPRAQGAGRGLAFITLAKLWFMVGGAAISFLLPLVFPKAVRVERYGQWGTVLACMSLLNNVIVTGSIQMVSRFASRGPSWVEGAKRAALRVNGVAVLAVAAIYFAAAPLVADFEHDERLVPLLRLSTGVILCYGLYAVFVGAANGAREFHKQAGLDIGFTTIRAGFVLAGAAVFGTVAGAVGGFVAAAATILVLSVLVVGWRAPAERPSAWDLARFIVPVALYLVVQNALMFIDYWWLKRLIAEGALAAGAAAEAAARAADAAVGRYNAALQIARLPYQAILAVTFVIFPLVSQAEFKADQAKTREYITKSLRLSLLVVTALATAVAARPEALLALLFPKNASGVNEFLQGAPALAALMFAYVAFSLFSIAGTIMNGAGMTVTAFLIGLATLGLDAGANRLAIGQALAGGGNPLAAAALASAASIFAGFVASLVALQQKFGASLPLQSALRVTLAAALGVLAGRLVPATVPGALGHLLRLGACALGGGVYLAALFASRELTLGELRGLVRRRGG